MPNWALFHHLLKVARGRLLGFQKVTRGTRFRFGTNWSLFRFGNRGSLLLIKRLLLLRPRRYIKNLNMRKSVQIGGNQSKSEISGDCWSLRRRQPVKNRFTYKPVFALFFTKFYSVFPKNLLNTIFLFKMT